MKTLQGLLVGMGVVGFIFWLFMAIGAICVSAYGLYLAFSASIILGLMVLFLEPTPLMIGLVMLAFHKNLAQTLIDFLNK